MSWTELRADEVTYTVQSKIRCFGCSRRLSRQRTFRAPIRDGVNRFEIRSELREQAAKWNPEGVCPTCIRSDRYVMLNDGTWIEKPADGVR